MKLILFRHGQALDRDLALAQKMDDSQRPLTVKGRERTEKMAQTLKKWDEKVDLIVTSPLVRAQQTADLVFQVFKAPQIRQSVELVPSAPPQAFAQWLKSHSQNATTILAVGHEPQLSVFASWALSGLSQTFLELKKSGALCLEIQSFDDFSSRSAELAWLVQPKFF